jgi:hypothetical protein
VFLVDPVLKGAFAAEMGNDELTVMIDMDPVIDSLNIHLLAGIPERNRVPVRLEGDHAVPGNLPDDPFLDRVGQLSLVVEQQVPLIQEQFRRFPMGGPVNPPIRCGCNPVQERLVEVIERSKGLPPEEPFDVLDARLHLALGLGAVGPMKPGTEPVIPGKIPEGGIPRDGAASKSRNTTTVSVS